MKIASVVWALTLSLVLGASIVDAAPSCMLPAELPQVKPQQPGEVRNIPTGGYLLSFSWSPEACFNAKRKPYGTEVDMDIQCGTLNHFAFVLHGLWPEGSGKDWPQYCRPVPPVSAVTVRSELCRTPSVSLIEHEWEKHGSCGWATPEAFFAQSTKLMNKIKLPDLSGLTRGQVNASAVRAAFMAANPSMPHGAIAIAANKGGWLEEVRLCLDTHFGPRPCPAYSYGAADGDKIKVARLK